MITPNLEPDPEPLAVVVMAAGQGKRMQDPSKPKVLYEIAAVPLIGHVLRLCAALESQITVCIVGYGRDQVSAYITEHFPEVKLAVQEEQLGTGHAVMQAERHLEGFQGDVLVLSGDVPLLTQKTVQDLLAVHRTSVAMATVLAVTMKDPAGYGRILRTESGSLDRIVEEKDATEQEREVHEINSGIYVFDARTLRDVLPRLNCTNAQGEYYLTDVFELLRAQFGLGSIAVMVTDDPIEVSGVNTKKQLEVLETEYLRRRVDTEGSE
ncbi:MAG: NTP transferase domain-containing protein [Bacteroidota bacterium]|nr:NTP transferase domain-containing protein [Bacteroidota bacterium]MDP4233831.1 NTP transferase domain-containing protein [Bacteroidota bacterium]MDP4289058.1 NTP transferase domain-containing protein [Bacteroidota bacterium]